MKSLIAISFLLFTTSNLNATMSRRINLECQNPGSHQDVAKTPVIKNITRSTIPATTKIFWTSSDGDGGYIYGPLHVNQTKSALGNPGNNYTCEAYFLIS